MSLRVMATSMQAREDANCIAMFGNEGILMSGSRPPEFTRVKKRKHLLLENTRGLGKQYHDLYTQVASIQLNL